MKTWHIYKGSGEAATSPVKLPDPPPWRKFDGDPVIKGTPELDERTERRGQSFQAGEREIETVNTALYLRRPLLVTGRPGVGKSSLACAVAYELGLGRVLYWPINTRSTLKEGLYQYDAVGRLQELQTAQLRWELSGHDQAYQPDMIAPEMIGDYIRLGPLGAALLPRNYPRVLIIDEIDKSDIDLPNDLLNVFEEGEFEIPELSRMKKVRDAIHVQTHDGGESVPVQRGKVKCREFPLIVLTSNGERELPAPFLRRCLRLEIPQPSAEKLAGIIRSHFGEADEAEWEQRRQLIDLFLKRREKGALATDQLLQAIHLLRRQIDLQTGVADEPESLINTLFRYLDRQEPV